ncbi:MAG: hypothetical protein JO209_05055 [Acidisphaera sp.]|nr:hypothetical protein [Acidisphaera sp.]
MDPFGYAKAMTDFWSKAGQAFMTGQESALQSLADGAKAMTDASARLTQLPEVGADAQEVTRAAQAVTELWSSASGLYASLAQQMAGARDIDPTVTATFERMLDPRTMFAATGEVEEMLQRMAEGPRLADLWNVERKFARLFRAWLNLRRRSLEHNAVMLQAWLDAGRRFAERYGAATRDGASPGAKATMALWAETANEVLLAAQRSEPFLKSQSALLEASTGLRMAQAEIAEYYGAMFGVPTRGELDDLYRTVTELKRELRAARRLTRTPPAPTPAAAPPARAAARPRARKPRK